MIYAQLAELEKFASANGAGFTNPPMLFVQTDGQSYRTQVALPVNKWLPEHPVYKTKRMVLGNNLTAEVTGGLVLADYLLLEKAEPEEDLE